MHYLQHRWPAERGPHYLQAKKLCKEAAQGLVPAEVARESFISAAIEAYLLA